MSEEDEATITIKIERFDQPHHEHCQWHDEGGVSCKEIASDVINVDYGNVIDADQATSCEKCGGGEVEFRCDMCGAEMCGKCHDEHGDHLLAYRPSDG